MKVISVSPVNPEAVLEVHAEPGGAAKPAVLIYPGGGYRALSEAERLPMVQFYRQRGFQPFVLMYSIGEAAHFPDPLLEGSRAVWEIRSHAAAYGVNPDQITLVGFSAGAHAATMLATLWNDECSRADTDIPRGGNRPHATVTGYTPTTFEDFYQRPKEDIQKAGGGPGPENLLDKSGGRFAEYPSLTTHKLVNAETPPAFLWKTTADFPESSAEYALALKGHGIDHELHIFNDDNRCAALEFDRELAVNHNDAYEKNTRLWAEMSVNWLRRIYGIGGEE